MSRGVLPSLLLASMLAPLAISIFAVAVRPFAYGRRCRRRARSTSAPSHVMVLAERRSQCCLTMEEAVCEPFIAHCRCHRCRFDRRGACSGASVCAGACFGTPGQSGASVCAGACFGTPGQSGASVCAGACFGTPGPSRAESGQGVVRDAHGTTMGDRAFCGNRRGGGWTADVRARLGAWMVESLLRLIRLSSAAEEPAGLQVARCSSAWMGASE